MKPYYEKDGITIWHGDCREVAPMIEPSTVDVVIADPPYGDTSLEWDAPVRGWLDLVEVTLKPVGSLWCFGSMRFFMSQAAAFERWSLAQDIVWEKQNGSSFHADRFKRVHEHMVQFYPKSSSWAATYKSPVTTPDATARTIRAKTRPAHMGHIDPRLMRSVIHAKNCHGYADHPTQKPTEILSPLLEYSCLPAGLILDPFMGSGITLIAARELGRRAIGVEIEEKYCEAAVRRLSQEILFREAT